MGLTTNKVAVPEVGWNKDANKSQRFRRGIRLRLEQ
jgi:hypothetical protein